MHDTTTPPQQQITPNPQNLNTDNKVAQQHIKTPKIGIVIPIYNVAPYLRECLDSVKNQTYTNLSIVLVNDGSTDNNESLNIAKEYVALDSRFILIDKENGGQSSARNVGIAWFSGKYQTQRESISFHSINNTTTQQETQEKETKQTQIQSTTFYSHNNNTDSLTQKAYNGGGGVTLL